ncbi:protein archease isoform X5 [Phoca vitulina]|uniref:protein archease isoform X5 n=1 Tax=Phoca vitulina TaxID=9720 RepID=UPI0013964BA6|nr:protein archease isoform X5 [Phoca vitulina]
MKGGSRVSSAAIMAQEEEDIRDYNLTEEQKARKAKYPPVIRKYECEFGSYSRCPVTCMGRYSGGSIRTMCNGHVWLHDRYWDCGAPANSRSRNPRWGEEFSLSKHPQGTEVKAITYSAMQVYYEEKPEVFVIIDI